MIFLKRSLPDIAFTVTGVTLSLGQYRNALCKRTRRPALCLRSTLRSTASDLPVSHVQASLSPIGDRSALPPGTTSLLVRLNATDLDSVRDWLQEWLQVYLFSAQGTVSVPLSMDTDGARAFLYFYAAVGDVRGILTLSAKREDRAELDRGQRGIMVRATSASRFINPAGTFTATLPGERKIIRTLFADMDKAFPDLVQVVYKPPYIRLKRSGGTASTSGHRVPITVFVGEIRGVPAVDVVAFLQAWGTEVQFGARRGRFFGTARLPPMSTEAVEDGLKISSVLEVNPGRGGSQRRETCELVVIVKRQRTGNVYSKSRGKGRPNLRPRAVSKNREIGSGDAKKILVLATSTHPDEIGTRAILQRLAQDLLSEFPRSRFHSPGK